MIFEGMSLKPECTVGEVPGPVFGLSEKGGLMETCLTCGFLSLHHSCPTPAPTTSPHDGHSQPYQPSTIKKAAEEGVIMFMLPPHTSHHTQANTVWGPFKVYSACGTYYNLLIPLRWNTTLLSPLYSKIKRLYTKQLVSN